MGARPYVKPLRLGPLGPGFLPFQGSGLGFDRLALVDRDRPAQTADPLDPPDALKPALDRLIAPPPPVPLKDGRPPLRFTRPLIMGILNVTPDSFSDGGKFLAPDAARAQAEALVAAGADLIDVGGESTRPGAEPVWLEEERRRVLPVIAAIRDLGVPISIDTRRAAIMAEAVEAGAALVNDVSGLTHDDSAPQTVAALGCPAILCHSQGSPQTMQADPRYDDVLLDIHDWFAARLDVLTAAGIAEDRLVLDPGIGFGKTVAHNLTLLSGLSLFASLGRPVLVGASRKRFIGAVSAEEGPQDRLAGSLTVALAALDQGAHILRVHDVAETLQAVRVRRAVLDAAGMDAFRRAGQA